MRLIDADALVKYIGSNIDPAIGYGIIDVIMDFESATMDQLREAEQEILAERCGDETD